MIRSFDELLGGCKNCRGAYDTALSEQAGRASELMILGSDCERRRALEAELRIALEQLGRKIEYGFLTDYMQIIACGVSETPALMIGGRILFEGRVPSAEEIMTRLPSRQ